MPSVDARRKVDGSCASRIAGRAGSRAGERAVEVLAALPDHAAAVVVDADQIEGQRALPDRDALVAQHAHAERRDRAHPAVGARVVVVVAGHEVDAVAAAQAREGRDLVRQQLDLAVDEIAGHGDEVRRERVHARDELLPRKRVRGSVRCGCR